MNFNSKIYVAGHRCMVGSAIVADLEKRGFKNIVFRTSVELNLIDHLKSLKVIDLLNFNNAFQNNNSDQDIFLEKKRKLNF